MSAVEFSLESVTSETYSILGALVALSPVLAGGAARSELTAEKVADYDVFFRPGAELSTAESLMLESGWKTIFKCPAGELVSMRKDAMLLQLICKPKFSTPGELISKFDFTACMFALDTAKTLHTTTDAIRDVFRKQLRINEIEYPVSTLRRSGKYIARGYEADGYFWREVVKAIGGKEWPNEALEMYPID